MKTRISAPQAPKYFDETFRTGMWPTMQRIFLNSVLPPVLRLLLKLRRSYYIPFVKIHLILDFDLVQEAFTRSDALTVTNKNKTDLLNWKPPFLLALPAEDQNYKCVHAAVRKYWSGDRLVEFRAIARAAFEGRIESLRNERALRFDAIHEYMIPAFLEIIDQYYGVKIGNKERQNEFIHALFVISGFFFSCAKQKRESKTYRPAQQAFDCTMSVLKQVISDAKDTGARGVLSELIANHGLDDDDLKSWLLGMILGFIPTSTNGQGRVLDVLLRQWPAMEWAINTVDFVGPVGAARPIDPDKIRTFLAGCHEALRLNYILPGLFREAAETLELGADTPRPIRIKKGAVLFVSGQTAMFDTRRFERPTAFNANRAYLKYLNYGHGMHFCVGWDISDIVMEETFRALVLAKFSRPRGGKRAWRGAYPWQYEIQIRPA